MQWCAGDHTEVGAGKLLVGNSDIWVRQAQAGSPSNPFSSYPSPPSHLRQEDGRTACCVHVALAAALAVRPPRPPHWKALYAVNLEITRPRHVDELVG